MLARRIFFTSFITTAAICFLIYIRTRQEQIHTPPVSALVRPSEQHPTYDSSLPENIPMPLKHDRVSHADMTSWSEVRNGMRDAVVHVTCHVAQFNWTEPYKTPEQGMSAGSAFFISSEGELITNAHVVNQARSVFIRLPSQGKRQFRAEVICVCMDRDLALLKVTPKDCAVLTSLIGPIPYLHLGDSDDVHGSDELMTLGYPLGQYSLKGTTGIVSGREHIDGNYLIQISAPLNPGNSGGPSINRRGEVIGVNTSGIAGAQNINYIIPSNDVLLFLQQLEHATAPMGDIKLLRKGYLGILHEPASEELTEYLKNPVPGGIFIVDVCPGSIGEQVGIRARDMLYSINGDPIDMFGEITVPWSEDKVTLQDYTSRIKFGDTITIRGYRSGEPFEHSFTFKPNSPFAVRYMYPGYEPIDYEVLGGMVFMNVSLNTVYTLLPSAPALIKYADPREQMKPSVIVTHIMPDSVATRMRVSCRPGTIIDEINGVPVTTLDEFRTASQESAHSGKLMIKTKDGQLFAYALSTILADEEQLSRAYFYNITHNTKRLKEAYVKTFDLPNLHPLTPASKSLQTSKSLRDVVQAAEHRIKSNQKQSTSTVMASTEHERVKKTA